MNRYIIFFLLLITGSLSAISQNTNLEQWRNEARKASEADFFPDQRYADVLYYTNLVRLSPKDFAREYLQPYADSLMTHDPALYRLEKNYIKSLFRELESLSPMQHLLPDPVLTKMAITHAEYSGKKGIAGHTGARGATFEKRAKENNLDKSGENCDYGRETGYEVLMALLVDEGIRSLGHRKNILDPDYTHAGVGWDKHKVYRVNCVIDYTRREETVRRGSRLPH